jgi:hypothetical protein
LKNFYSQFYFVHKDGNTCQSFKLSENGNSGFFGIHFDGGFETIGTPSEVFNFNDGKGGTVSSKKFLNFL